MATKPSERIKPLEGITVLDFTWSVAGPTMTRYLGAFGARILKVEWPKGPDPMRTSMFRSDTKQLNYNNGAFFGNLNIGKESLTIDVKSDSGKEVIEHLLSKVDVVTESFSSSVMKSWGLSFERMLELNRKIVYASISGFGHNGPHGDKNTWGPTAQAMSGMTALAGLPGRDPAGWGYSYLDVAAGYMGAIGVMAAIRTVERTGKGQRLDMSQVETGLSLAGPVLTDYLSSGKIPPHTYPGGNHSLDNIGRDAGYRGDLAPLSDIFRTSGEKSNDWVAVSISTETHWKKLVEIVDILGKTCRDVKFQDITSNMYRIHGALRDFCLKYDKYTITDMFSKAGIPVGPVQGGEDRVETDPQLKERGLLTQYAHPELDTLNVQSLPIVSSAGDRHWQFTEHFPMLGQDTKAVLKDFLGYSDSYIQKLDEEHILWPEGIEKEMTIERSLW